MKQDLIFSQKTQSQKKMLKSAQISPEIVAYTEELICIEPYISSWLPSKYEGSHIIFNKQAFFEDWYYFRSAVLVIPYLFSR